MKQSFIKLVHWLVFATAFCCGVVAAASQGITPEEEFRRHIRFTEVQSLALDQIGVIMGITQDAQGFIWFGGNNGLARFDGYDLKIYRNDPLDPKSLSNNSVNKVIADRRGRIWVGTNFGLNRYDPITDSFVLYDSKDRGFGRLSNNGISGLALDSKGNIWISILREGFAMIEENSGKVVDPKIIPSGGIDTSSLQTISIEVLDNDEILIGTPGKGVFRYSHSSSILRPELTFAQLGNHDVYSILESSTGDIWVGLGGGGLVRYNPSSPELKHYKHSLEPGALSHNVVWRLYEDQSSRIWVATDNALNLFSEERQNFSSYEYLPGSEQSGKVRSIFESKAGDLWFGLFPAGVAQLDQDAMVFVNYQYSVKNPNSLSHTSVTSIVEDQHQNLWIGTEKGLNYLDRKTGKISRYYHIPGDPKSLPSNAILSLLIDSENTLWVGTWKGGWASFDDKKKEFSHATVYMGDQSHMTDEAWTMYQDKAARLWVAGLYTKTLEEKDFKTYQTFYPQGDTLSSIRVKAMLEDQFGVFWLGTKAGLDVLDRETGKIKHYYHDANDPSSISDHFVNCILEDDEGKLWFGTRGGGVNIYNRATDSFRSLRVSDGLPDDSVVGMVDDHNGHIWMIGGGGLVKYTKSTKRFKTYDKKNGLAGSLFHRNAIILSQQGEVIFGGVDGLTRLRPEALVPNPFVPPVILTELEVLNKQVDIGDKRNILIKPINQTQSITLSHTDSVFSLEFAALNFRSSSHNQYAYQLSGFDSDWNFVGTQRKVTYTNLDPGVYHFRVKGSNNSGIWNDQYTELKITILPPWWKTGWAFAFYILLLVLLVCLVVYVLHRFREARNQLIINSRLKQVDQLKDAFLANTSHELRTPLNGIIGLTEAILKSPDSHISEETRSKLDIVVSSGRQLSNIINDILDFSKFRNYQVKLHKSYVDLSVLVDKVVSVTLPLVRSDAVTLRSLVPSDLPKIFVDEQRVSQILFNLVGNAIKFTEQGEIVISAARKADSVLLTIRDTGVGIRQSDLQRIFEPFEQSLDAGRGKFAGSGLGLAVTKQLVDLHDGKIWVSSNLDVGSEFCVMLPISNRSEMDIPSASVVSSSVKESSDRVFSTEQAPKIAPPVEAFVVSSSIDRHVLIVDDEPVNRLVLAGYLGKSGFKIDEAGDGIEALNKLDSEIQYDLVLLDVMMPKMSGYETCEKIRERYPLYRLPVIFLTAKSQVEDLAKGYQVGANDFMFKPVVREEFLAKVHIQLQLLDQFRQTNNI